jgi:uncharacterized NAD(P)/FAD-binding protein YdhS
MELTKQKRIAIIGAGFSGMMTATHLIKNAINAEIYLFDENPKVGRGVAYAPYSKKQLLNVVAGKMSAFPEHPNHFVEWVLKQPSHNALDRNMIFNAFLPRDLYGKYLEKLWEAAKHEAAFSGIEVHVIQERVTELDYKNNKASILTASGFNMKFDACVIATGNQLPGNPNILDDSFYKSKRYFQNPWDLQAVKGLSGDSVLILGNGLTMVDTVIGLLENGFNGKIISLSPNGFNILPHRHNGMIYEQLSKELTGVDNLKDLVRLVYSHVRLVRTFGLTAEPIIDALRPHVQRFWQQFTLEEKKLFLKNYRHLWGVARHRIPMHIHDKIQRLQIEGRLQILAGKIQGLKEKENSVEVFYTNKEDLLSSFKVSRVVNCTGPESDFDKLHQHFLKGAKEKGILVQDELKLGIQTNVADYRIRNEKGKPQAGLYTLGANLRGELWESTAVNELRQQAREIATIVSNDISK